AWGAGTARAREPTTALTKAERKKGNGRFRSRRGQQLLAERAHPFDADFQITLRLAHVLDRRFEHLNALPKVGTAGFHAQKARGEVLDGGLDLVLQDLEELAAVRFGVDGGMMQHA